jgi:hypothetical protein
MSASEKDLDKQRKRHKAPLLGFVAIFVFVAIILVWWIDWEFGEAEAPRGAETQIDGRTGERVDGPASDTPTDDAMEGAAPDAIDFPPRPVTNTMGREDD